MPKYKPVILLILDGLGVSLEKEGNPVFEAKKPTFDIFEKEYPFTILQASGVAVGLPWGEAGNSEVGHLTMGSGRVIYHHLPRIIYSIHDGSFFKNPAFLKAAEHVKQNNSKLHIVGLISSGSVHSYIDHFYALLDFVKKEKLEKVFVHIFSDGKDAPPKEGAKFLDTVEKRIKKDYPMAQIGSVIGRFYALDRDDKWDRIKTAYELLTEGRGQPIFSVFKHLEECYGRDLSDEFIEPAVFVDEKNTPVGLVQDNDALIFSDFREDSMRELVHAFIDEDFDKFQRKKINNLLAVTMTEYQKGLNALPAFPQLDINWPMSRVLAEAGMRQLHIAETQKYAHVTYFFNGGLEKPFPGEDRIIIPSLSAVHFDEAPEMRAKEITSKILENFDKYDLIVANFANGDMVGHSGNFKAAVKAVEILDESVSKIVERVMQGDGIMLITADHGNVELKRNILSGEKLTEHSINPVPFYVVGRGLKREKPRTSEEIISLKQEAGGILTDIAPTAIELLELEKPQEMTGKSLLETLKKTL